MPRGDDLRGDTVSTATTTRRRNPLPAEIPLDRLVVVIDNREKLPADVSPLKSISGTLQTGDYSLLHLEGTVAIERKSLSDLLSCIGGSRERFERELERLRAFPYRAVVVECSWEAFQRGDWRSNVSVASAVGSVLAWQLAGVPFVFARDHADAGKTIARMLSIVGRRAWRQLRGLATPPIGETEEFSAAHDNPMSTEPGDEPF